MVCVLVLLLLLLLCGCCRCQVLYDNYARWLTIISWVLTILNTLACASFWRDDRRAARAFCAFFFSSLHFFVSLLFFFFASHLLGLLSPFIRNHKRWGNNNRWSCFKVDMYINAHRLKCIWKQTLRGANNQSFSSFYSFPVSSLLFVVSLPWNSMSGFWHLLI